MNDRRPPPTLPGFEGASRVWDSRHERFSVKVGAGQCYVSSHDEVLSTVLGSCIAACIHDPRSGLGGMNHFMLPSGPGSSTRVDSEANRYGNFAMETLINAILKNGGRRERLVAKVFGG
ncbi:MAG: chemoreceptor glutamine deamidase CheD, partial [Planctomycetes bacterium]|nr:chemoreceptor glutamine deamidase CheD [Planctomycetota bacterium]